MDPKRILTEDKWFIAVHKYAGELVIADRWGKEPRENILLYSVGDYLRSQGHQMDESGRDLYPVHRLDRQTSGIVLFAKHQEAHKKLSEMFEIRKIKKTYWAVVVGEPDWNYANANIAMKRAEGKKGRGRALIDLKQGNPAETEFVVKERFKNAALIEAHPKSGRLHQIRVHLRALGNPLIFDENYGISNWLEKNYPQIKLNRTPLHARAIDFVHPHSSNKIHIECPLDQDFTDLLTELRG